MCLNIENTCFDFSLYAVFLVAIIIYTLTLYTKQA